MQILQLMAICTHTRAHTSAQRERERGPSYKVTQLGLGQPAAAVLCVCVCVCLCAWKCNYNVKRPDLLTIKVNSFLPVPAVSQLFRGLVNVLLPVYIYIYIYIVCVHWPGLCRVSSKNRPRERTYRPYIPGYITVTLC